MIINAKVQYVPASALWVLTIKHNDRVHIGHTRESAIAACMSNLKPNQTIRLVS